MKPNVAMAIWGEFFWPYFPGGRKGYGFESWWWPDGFHTSKPSHANQPSCEMGRAMTEMVFVKQYCCMKVAKGKILPWELIRL